jgi:hypothetical protein
MVLLQVRHELTRCHDKNFQRVSPGEVKRIVSDYGIPTTVALQAATLELVVQKCTRLSRVRR